MANGPLDDIQNNPSPAMVIPQDTRTTPGNGPLDEFQDTKDNGISSQIPKVINSDPDRNARAIKASRETGLTPEYTDKNLDSIEKSSSVPSGNQLSQMQIKAPSYFAWANKDSKNLGSTFGDMQAHVEHESVFNDIHKTILNDIADFEKYVVNPVYHSNYVFGQQIQDMADNIQTPDLDAGIIDSASRGNFRPVISKIAAGIPSLGEWALNPVGMMDTTAIESQQKHYEQSLKNLGVPEFGSDQWKSSAFQSIPWDDVKAMQDVALSSSIAKAGVETATTALVFKYLGKLYSPLTDELGSSAAKEISKTALVMKSAGAFETQAQANLFANAAMDKITGENPDAFKGYLKQSAEAGLEAGTQAIAMAAPALAIPRAGEKIDVSKVKNSFDADLAIKQKEGFLKLLDTAKKLKLSDIDPKRAGEISDLAGNLHGIPYVHVPLDAFHEVYGNTAAKMAKEIGPETEKAYNNALNGSGTTVKIPIGEILHTKADIQSEKLSDNIKFQPGLKTVSEAKEPKIESNIEGKTETKQSSLFQKIIDRFTKNNKNTNEIEVENASKEVAEAENQFGYNQKPPDDLSPEEHDEWTKNQLNAAQSAVEFLQKKREEIPTYPESEWLGPRETDIIRTAHESILPEQFETYREDQAKMIAEVEKKVHEYEAVDVYRKTGKILPGAEDALKRVYSSDKGLAARIEEARARELSGGTGKGGEEPSGRIQEQKATNPAAERTELTKRITDEVDSLPVFRAAKWLSENIETPLKTLANSYMAGGATEEEQAALAHAAQAEGYKTSSDLAYSLFNSDREREIKERVDAEMDLRKDLPHDDVFMSMLNKNRSEALAKEIALIDRLIRDKASTESGDSEKLILPKKTPEEIEVNRKNALEKARQELDKAKAQAKEEIGSKLLKDAKKIGSFLTEVKNAAARVEKARKENDLNKMLFWKRKMLLNQELAKLSFKTSPWISKTTMSLRKMGRIANKPLSFPRGNWLQMSGLLEQVGLKKASKFQDYSFKKIADSMEMQGKEPSEIADAVGLKKDLDGNWQRETLDDFRNRIAPDNPQLSSVLQNPQNLQWGKMTVQDLRNLNDSVKGIYKHGVDETELEFKGKKVELAIHIQKMMTQLEKRGLIERDDMGNVVSGKHSIMANNNTTVTDMVHALLTWDDQIMTYGNKLETVAYYLDGGDHGPFNDLTDMYRDATTEENRIQDEHLKVIPELMQQHYTAKELNDYSGKKIPIETSQGTQHLTKEDIRGIYEYMGTKEGLKDLKQGRHFTDEDLRKIVDTMDQKDIDFIHQFNEKIVKPQWPDFVKKRMEVSGVEPKPVDLLPVTTKYGTREGVYRPLVPDRKRSFFSRVGEWSQGLTVPNTENGQWEPFRGSYTEHGFLETRVNRPAVAPNLTNIVWDDYLSRTRHYLAWTDAAKQANKILRDKNFQQGMKTALGPGASLFSEQHKYLISTNPYEGFISSILAHMRASLISAQITLRPQLYLRKITTDASNLYFGEKGGGLKYIQNVNGFGPSMMWLKQDRFGRMEQHVFGNKKLGSLVEKINGMDPYMKSSALDFHFNAQELARIFKGSNPLSSFYKLNGYIAERSADMQLRYPKYWDVYSEEISKGSTEEDAKRTAAKYVDRILGSASKIHHVGPMRGGELERQITPVISFANNLYNLWWQKYRSYHELKGSGKTMAGLLTLMGGTMLYYVFNGTQKWIMNQASMATQGKSVFQKDGEESGKAFKDLGKDVAEETAQGIPYASYLTQAALHKGQTELPAQRYIQVVTKAFPELFTPKVEDENWWNDELEAISTTTSTSHLVENSIMHFADFMSGRDDLGDMAKDFFSPWKKIKKSRRGSFGL